MKINYDDLVAYLDQSEDWTKVDSSPDWLVFHSPAAPNGTPLEAVLPADPDTPLLGTHLAEVIDILATFEILSPNDMADRITPTSVKALLDAIKHFDCEPSVFYVNVTAADHQADYTANAEFRTSMLPAASSLRTDGDTPEDALQELLTVLKTKWGRCPHCGQHLNGEDQEDPS